MDSGSLMHDVILGRGCIVVVLFVQQGEYITNVSEDGHVYIVHPVIMLRLR